MIFVNYDSLVKYLIVIKLRFDFVLCKNMLSAHSEITKLNSHHDLLQVNTINITI